MTIPGEDLSVFFDGLDATSATWRPAAGGSYPVTVIFSEPYVTIDPVSGVSVGSADPSAIAIEVDMATVKHGDQIDINAVTYKVIKVRADGAGLVTLDLRKA